MCRLLHIYQAAELSHKHDLAAFNDNNYNRNSVWDFVLGFDQNNKQNVLLCFNHDHENSTFYSAWFCGAQTNFYSMYVSKSSEVYFRTNHWDKNKLKCILKCKQVEKKKKRGLLCHNIGSRLEIKVEVYSRFLSLYCE